MIANIIRNAKKTVTGGDPYYSAVSLLLHMDGANGSTTFTDSGPNAIAVTAVGNTQISTTQSKYGGASAYFDGAGDYLDIPYGNSLNITTDYTIEFWMRADSVTGYAPIFTITSATTSFFGGIYVVRNGSAITFETRPADGSGSSVIAITGGSISTNTWYHVAASVSGNSARLFINGVQIGSTTTFPTRTFTPTGARIGRFANNYISGLVDFNGFIDDLRISLFARYVSNFTPPASALPTTASSTPADPYYGYTSLLLHMDGSSGSTNFVDSGPNALAVTAVGNAQVSTTQSKYGGASGSFDGTGDYLSISDSSAPVLGSSDWTIEAWIYISVAKNFNCFYAKRQPGGYGLAVQVDGSNNLTISASTTGSSWALAGSSLGGGYTAGSWIHVAVVRSGNTITGYKNGISTGTQTLSGTIWPSTGYAAAVASGLAGNTSQDFNGNIDDLRVTKYARYTSAFAPPAQAHLEYANGNDRHFSNVSLLLHMDGANGSTTFTDNSSNALAIAAVGDAKVSTTQGKFGGASAYFDGTGDYLTVANYGSLFTFGTGDFTVEAWVYVTSSATSFSFLLTQGTNTDFAFYVDNTRLGMWDGASSSYYSSSGAVPLNQWVHVAFTRTGGFIRGFANGVLTGSVSNSRNMTNAQAVRVVASSTYPNASTCYVDDLRVTKGVARYTATFTPPTTAFPNS